MAFYRTKTRRVVTHFFLAGLMAALLVLSLASPASSSTLQAASGPKIQVKAGYDSFYKMNSWLPVQVNLSLPEGNPNFDGWVEASYSNFDPVSRIYRRAVQLVPPANRQVWLYLPSSGRNIVEVQVRLTNQAGTVIEKFNQPIQPLDQSELLLGVISDDSGALSGLNGQRLTQPYNRGSALYNPNYYSRTPQVGNRPTFRVAHLAPSDLPPDSSGWDGLDGLALTDLSSVTMGDQTINQASLENAAAAWLAQGRFLLAAGDSSLRRGGFLTNFLPVKAAGPSQNKAFPTELGQFLNGAPAPAQLLIADSTPVPGAMVQLSLDGKPLLAKKPFGLGATWFTATELRTLPNSVLTGLWSTALRDFEPHMSYLSGLRQPIDIYWPWTNQLNPNTKTATLPDIGIIALVLAIYIFLLGPLAYFGLKKLGKRELGWVIVPVLALSLTAGFYIVGVATSGEPLVMSRFSVVTLGETTQGKLAGGVTSLGTLYSSNRLNVQLNVSDQAQATVLTQSRNFLNPRNPNPNLNPAGDLPVLQQGPGGGFGKVLMGQDDQRSFALQSPVPAEIGEGIIARLTAQGNELSGTIENRTGTDWSELSIWKPGSLIYQVPALRAGEKLTLTKNLAIATGTDNLIFALSGMEDPGNGAGGFTQLYNPRVYQSQKAAAIATLIGVQGEVLPKDSNRAYLIGWKQASFNFPLQLQNQAASTTDLTLLFEAIVLP
jgi:hypothetical protein